MENSIRLVGELENIFVTTTVIVKLTTNSPSFKDKVDCELENNKVMHYFELFTANLLGIEIQMDKVELDIDQTQIIYFPKHPVYAYLSRSTRTSIMDSIDRSTHRDKIIGLV